MLFLFEALVLSYPNRSMRDAAEFVARAGVAAAAAVVVVMVLDNRRASTADRLVT